MSNITPTGGGAPALFRYDDDELSRRLTSPSTAVTRVMPAVSSEPLAVLA